MALTSRSNSNSSSYWRDRSEKELLELEFTTTDPERLQGMSDDPPPPGPVIIEFKYDLRGRQSKARCVHCKYDNHFKGFVIRVADGSRRLVGKDCGRKLYGGLFEQAHQDFKSALDLAAALKRRQRLLLAEEILTNGLDCVLEHHSLRQYSRMAWQTCNALGPETVAALDLIARRGNSLTVPEKIRDIAAEEREVLPPEHVEALNRLSRADQKRYRRRHDLPEAERYTWIDRPIGVLKGTALLYSTGPDGRLPMLQREIVNCFGALRQKTRWTETTLSLASKQLLELVASIERQLEKLRAPIAFFEPAHLRALCEWDKARSQPAGLRCGEGWIERVDEYGEAARATLLLHYEMPSAEFVKLFRTAIELTPQTQPVAA